MTAEKQDPTCAPDLEQLEAEVEVTVYQASGPGGQHRNRSYSAVRLKHLPTSIVVTAADSRSRRRDSTTAPTTPRSSVRTLRNGRPRAWPPSTKGSASHWGRCGGIDSRNGPAA